MKPGFERHLPGRTDLRCDLSHGRSGCEQKSLFSREHGFSPPREPGLYPNSSRVWEGDGPPFQAMEASHWKRVPLASPLMGRGTQIKETDTYLLLRSFVSTHDIWFRRRSCKTNYCVSSPPTGL